jgi:predicted TIM-barrel fold metal-dependent hydrolase
MTYRLQRMAIPPYRLFTRREALGAVLASSVAALPGCKGGRKPDREEDTVWSVPVVDVHCHVFNASDLSAKQFVRRVITRDHEPQVVLESLGGAIAELVVAIIKQPAPSAQSEALSIVRGEPIESDALDQRTDIDILKAALSESAAVSGGLELPAFSDGTTVDGRPASADGVAPSPGQGGAETAEGPLIDAVVRELKAEGLLGEEEAFLLDDIARALLKSVGFIGRHVRWGLMLLWNRRRIVDRMVNLYGGTGRVSLFTPALVDFTQWLDENPVSPFADQVHVMDLIQRQHRQSLVHCFAPFNPLNQLLSVRRDESNTPLDLVKHAVNECGFVGVKLYPPMGFYPYDNASKLTSVLERLNDIRDLKSGLDTALGDLYKWCGDEGVAVMAHATNSNAAGRNFGQNASPANWESAFKAFPKLRVNLGHFGDFEEERGDALDSAIAWEHIVGRLAKSGHQIFADLSYLGEFLGDNASADVRSDIRKQMTRYLAKQDPQARTLMYGSDWIMLGREPDHDSYPSTVKTLLESISMKQAAINNVFSRNAVRFLGLNAGMPTRGRLEDYYRKHRLDSARLSVFDS